MNARIPCSVSADLSRHLDQIEADDRFDETLDALMVPGAEFCPTSADNLAEAIGEAGDAFWLKLASALQGDSRSALGCDVIRTESFEFWVKRASPVAAAKVKALYAASG